MNVLPPKRLRDARLDNVIGGLEELLAPYAEDPRGAIKGGQTVMLYGPEGAGKSYVAAAMHHAWSDKTGWLVVWMDLNTWGTDIRDAHDNAQLVENSPLLILDDLGREDEKTRPLLTRALMTRFNQGTGVTIITTNCNVDVDDQEECELTRIYGRALRSRLLDAHVALVDGNDRRLD